MQALAEELEANQQKLAQADKHADAQATRISHLEQQYDLTCFPIALCTMCACT